VNKRFLLTMGGFLGLMSFLFLQGASSFRELVLANGLLGLGGGISIPAIMALGVIEGRRTKAMGSLMGLLALGHSLGMLGGPLLAGMLIDLFSFSSIFIFGAFVMGAGIVIFLRNS